MFRFARECTASSSSSSTSSSCCPRCWVVSRRFKGISARREHPFDRTCGFGRATPPSRCAGACGDIKRNTPITLHPPGDRGCTRAHVHQANAWGGKRTDERIRTNRRKSTNKLDAIGWTFLLSKKWWKIDFAVVCALVKKGGDCRLVGTSGRSRCWKVIRLNWWGENTFRRCA